MSGALTVRGLYKHYPAFDLQDVSFAVEKGSITGLIGRNGAGKTTTIKAILNLICADAGEIRLFGTDLRADEREFRRRVGYACGAVDYYKKKRISKIAEVTRRFYPDWDEAAYREYLRLFELDEGKTPSALSEGMRVKLNIALALSHGAEFIILDEPTSGLDPVSRDELLELLRDLRDRGVTILFSSHIITDLENCADSLVYLQRGRVHSACSMTEFIETGRAKGMGKTAEEIMVAYEREARHEKAAL